MWDGNIKPKGGYGLFKVRGKKILAHRAVYEVVVGPIPEGMTLDHLCRVTLCVNPEHLEPITRSENSRRAARARWG